MSKGIAVTFQHKFCLRNELLKIECFTGDMVALKRGSRFICQLITKERCFHKPRAQDLYGSLISLREFMQANRINEIAVPELSAGLDQIPINTVIDLLNNVFTYTPVKKFMYHL